MDMDYTTEQLEKLSETTEGLAQIIAELNVTLDTFPGLDPYETV